MLCHQVILVSLFGFCGFVFGQTNHQIVVGGAAGLVYSPSNITAAVGDTVTFIYQPKNHTVTQSSFLSPCSPLRNGSLTGFDSGYVPVDSGAKEAPAWTLEITQDASPIWFYCATGTHCQSGMVGAINAAPNGNKTYNDFRVRAMATSSSNSSAGAAPSGVGAVPSGTLSSVDGNAAASSASGTTPASPGATGLEPTLGNSLFTILLAGGLTAFTLI